MTTTSPAVRPPRLPAGLEPMVDPELDHDTAHKIGEEVGLPSRADAWVAKAKALTAEAE